MFFGDVFQVKEACFNGIHKSRMVWKELCQLLIAARLERFVPSEYRSCFSQVMTEALHEVGIWVSRREAQEFKVL